MSSSGLSFRPLIILGFYNDLFIDKKVNFHLLKLTFSSIFSLF